MGGYHIGGRADPIKEESALRGVNKIFIVRKSFLNVRLM
jgi:hypothetical protein